MGSLKRTNKFLIAPMDWGLGHATRCIPVINLLLQKKFEVLLAGSGESLQILQSTFPGLQSFHLPAYNPVYPKGNGMVWTMAWQLPRFMGVIQQEHEVINRIIEQQEVDYLISDNRYGCYSGKIPSVFLGHQLKIIMPAGWKWMEPIVNAFNVRQIQKFSYCWVPAPGAEEFPGLMQNKSLKIPVSYIGYLSRFKHRTEEQVCDVTVLASGPEPQRSKFIEEVLAQLSAYKGRMCIIKGNTDGSSEPVKTNRITTYDYVMGDPLNEILLQSRMVIARAGYSTVMDLMHTGGKAILVPTPNQTEQEYIAARLMEKKIAVAVKQDSLDVMKALCEIENYQGFSPLENHAGLLENAIDELCLKS